MVSSCKAVHNLQTEESTNSVKPIKSSPLWRLMLFAFQIAGIIQLFEPIKSGLLLYFFFFLFSHNALINQINWVF